MTGKYQRMTDPQWEVIAKYLPVQRKREINLREVLDAIRYMVCTGVQWRNLPENFPKWNAVYYYFQKWTADQTLFRLNAALNELDRVNQGKEAKPSLLLVDSQSVKLAPMIGTDRGFDAHKKINGRKRQKLTDTGGRIWDTCVHAANLYDADGASLLFDQSRIDVWWPRLKKFLTDQHYQGTFSVMATDLGIDFEVRGKIGDAKGFEVIPIRWVVERTIAWSNFCRRLVKDYERTIESSASWTICSNIYRILGRI